MISSADARAVGLLAASISLAGVAAAASLTILQIGTLRGLVQLHGVLWGLATPSLLSAIMAALALRSREMVLPGYAPGAFENDWTKSEDRVIVSMLRNSQKAIATNTRALNHLISRNQLSIDLLSMAPAGGLFGGLIAGGGYVSAPAGFIAIVGAIAYGWHAWKKLRS